MKLLVLLALVVLLAATACGGESAPLLADPGSSTTSVTVVATVAATTTTHQLSCDPLGGDHPAGQAACDALLKAAATLAPPAGDRACTEVYGGAEMARITGTVRGAAVDRALDRANGCGIADWEALGVVLPKPVGVPAP